MADLFQLWVQTFIARPTCGQRGQPLEPHSREESQTEKFGRSAATLQKMQHYFGAGRADSPTQKIHCKDRIKTFEAAFVIVSAAVFQSERGDHTLGRKG